MSKAKYPNTAKVSVNVAKAVADSRKKYRQFDADAAVYGLPVAMYNAGFIAGQDHERGKKKRRKAARASVPTSAPKSKPESHSARQ